MQTTSHLSRYALKYDKLQPAASSSVSVQYLLDDLMTQLTAAIVSTLGLSNALYWLLLSHTQQYTELQSAALAFVAERSVGRMSG